MMQRFVKEKHLLLNFFVVQLKRSLQQLFAVNCCKKLDQGVPNLGILGSLSLFPENDPSSKNVKLTFSEPKNRQNQRCCTYQPQDHQVNKAINYFCEVCSYSAKVSVSHNQKIIQNLIGQVRLRQVRLSKVRLRQIGQVKIGQVKIGQVKIGLVKIGQVKIGQVK